jgi:peptidoglycan DL-endopeptidase LytE
VGVLLLRSKKLIAALTAAMVLGGATAANAQHIVKKGETLGGIAKQYGMGYKDIIELNPHFPDPNLIHVGDTVIYRTADRAQDIVDYARSLQDRTTYTYGGQENFKPPLYTDCSGWTQHIYGKFGIKLPRVSRDQAKVGTPVKFQDMKKGDLMFFSTRADKVITHVGIYMGDGYWISNLSTKQDVEILSTFGNWTQKYFLWAQRVL